MGAAIQRSAADPAIQKAAIGDASRVLAILAECYGKPVSADLVRIWAQALAQAPKITGAVLPATTDRIIATRKWMPTIAEFLEVARLVMVEMANAVPDLRPALPAREETADERAARLLAQGMDAESRRRLRGDTPLARSVNAMLDQERGE
jgi:hypothetical protein